MYRLIREQFVPTGEVEHTKDGTVKWQRVAGWKEVGLVRDMEDARARYPRGLINGYAFVLEPVGD